MYSYPPWQVNQAWCNQCNLHLSTYIIHLCNSVTCSSGFYLQFVYCGISCPLLYGWAPDWLVGVVVVFRQGEGYSLFCFRGSVIFICLADSGRLAQRPLLPSQGTAPYHSLQLPWILCHKILNIHIFFSKCTDIKDAHQCLNKQLSNASKPRHNNIKAVQKLCPYSKHMNTYLFMAVESHVCGECTHMCCVCKDVANAFL